MVSNIASNRTHTNTRTNIMTSHIDREIVAVFNNIIFYYVYIPRIVVLIAGGLSFSRPVTITLYEGGGDFFIIFFIFYNIICYYYIIMYNLFATALLAIVC